MDFGSALERIEKEIRKVEVRKQQRYTQFRQATTAILTVSITLYLLMALFWYRYWLPEIYSPLVPIPDKAIYTLPIIITPLFIFACLSCCSRTHKSLEHSDQARLELLYKKKEDKIAELKSSSKFYDTLSLLERYGEEDDIPITPRRTPRGRASTGSMVTPAPTPIGAGQPLSRTATPGPSAAINGTITPGNGISRPGAGAPTPLQTPQQPTIDVTRFPSPTASSSGVVGRLVDWIVKDGPAYRFALICGQCGAHNGLALEEEFYTIRYICPRCGMINGPRGDPNRTPKGDLAANGKDNSKASAPSVSKQDLGDTHASRQAKLQSLLESAAATSPDSSIAKPEPGNEGSQASTIRRRVTRASTAASGKSPDLDDVPEEEPKEGHEGKKES